MLLSPEGCSLLSLIVLNNSLLCPESSTCKHFRLERHSVATKKRKEGGGEGRSWGRGLTSAEKKKKKSWIFSLDFFSFYLLCLPVWAVWFPPGGCMYVVSACHCVFAAGGGRAQLMSLSAAGWSWKRPFVGSCSASKSPSLRSALVQPTGERNGTVETAPLPTRLTHPHGRRPFHSKSTLLGSLCPTEVERTKDQEGGKRKKKTWGRSEKKVGRWTEVWLFCLGKEKKRIYSSRKTRREESSDFSEDCGLVLFCPLLGRVSSDTCKGAVLVWFEQQSSPAGRERKQMKMLEICLKLVGCKSKKGLSSSSSCYLEGKNTLRWRLPHLVAQAVDLWFPVSLYIQSRDGRKQQKIKEKPIGTLLKKWFLALWKRRNGEGKELEHWKKRWRTQGNLTPGRVPLNFCLCGDCIWSVCTHFDLNLFTPSPPGI